MFSIEHKIRYSEVGRDGNLRLTNILDLLQDTSTFDTIRIGHTVNSIENLNYAWVILEWQIEIVRVPKLYENIKVTTFPYNFRSFIGYRNYYIEDEKGNIIIKADSTWALLDVETKKTVKINRNLFNYEESEQLDMDLDKSRFWKNFVLNDAKKICNVYIDDFFIDTNEHVNNAKYFRILEGYLPKIKKAKQFRVIYKKAAQEKAKLSLYELKYESNKDIYAIADENQDIMIYVLIMF